MNGSMRVGVKPGQWGWTFRQLTESWDAAEARGFDVLSCFDHVSSSPSGLQAWDAPSLLSAMAARTERIGLGVHVINTSLRHPFLLAGQIAVAQAMSRGRLEVGLGTGSYPLARFDHVAMGIPFPPFGSRLRRLTASCRVLPALWRGEEVEDEALGLRRASLGPVAIQPPRIILGGRSEQVLRVAARYADGWNAVEPDPGRYSALCRRLDELCGEAGRRPIAKEVQLWARELDLTAARENLQRFGDAGASTVIVVLDKERGAEEVQRLADAVL